VSGVGGEGPDLAWLIEALIASTLLMGFVLAVRKHVQRAVGAQLAYWLWALPALRMAMPPLPAEWREQTIAPIAAASETVRVFIISDAAPDPAAAAFPWLLLVAGLWLAGAAAFFVWHGAAHFRYVREILAPPARREELDDGTTLVESDAATGPVAFGVLKRFVAVPRDFTARYDEDERRLALAHELGHHARGDLIANWIGLAVLAVHWFNPVAWIAYRKFRADQEMANDARVLAALPAIERHAYACAILKAAHGRAVTAACHLHTIEDLKGRLKMLKANRKSRRVLMAGATGIAAMTVAGLGLTASGAAAEKIRTVAAVQVPALVAEATPPTPATPPAAPDAAPAPAAPDAVAPLRKKRIVIVRDGKTETYEGADADAYLAANPDIAHRGGADGSRRHRIVIRSKDGKTQAMEGAEADAYLKAHPEFAPPAPPAPPAAPAPLAGSLPSLPRQLTMTTPDGKRTVIRTLRRDGVAPRAFVINTPDVIEGDCGGKGRGDFVQHSKGKDGRPRIMICKVQIERFAADQARAGAAYAKFGLVQALAGLDTGRNAIMNNRSLSEEARRDALAGIESARAEIEREIREAKAD
jgi:beta-lactamase regulating signal transducer with metallopeptidase domain